MASKITKSISRSLYTSRHSYRLLSSTSSSSSPSITQQPSLPTVRSSFLLSHSLLPTNPNFLKPFSLNSVRFRVNRSGNSPYTPGTGDRAPTEMAPLFPGCDYEHWLIVMDKPGGEGAHKQQMIDCYVQTLAKVLGSAPTEMAPLFPGCDYEHWLTVMDEPGRDGAHNQQMIDCYVQTLAKVLGSEEEAKKKIYNVSCERYFGFGCEVDEETANKMEGLPGVLFVLPDSYVDPEYKDYGAELFVNGEIVQRSPERQRRVEPVPQRQDRIRPNRYNRRRDNMR